MDKKIRETIEELRWAKWDNLADHLAELALAEDKPSPWQSEPPDRAGWWWVWDTKETDDERKPWREFVFDPHRNGVLFWEHTSEIEPVLETWPADHICCRDETEAPPGWEE